MEADTTVSDGPFNFVYCSIKETVSIYLSSSRYLNKSFTFCLLDEQGGSEKE